MKRHLLATAALLLSGGLASCSRGPEQPAAAPSSTPVRAAARAPVPAPARAAAPASPTAPEVTVATAPAAAPVPAAAAPARVVAPARVATYAQAGRVLDESGQPLVGATVLLRGTTYGTSTDATGGYLLDMPRGQNTLVIGYAGYEDETASSHDGQPLTTTLLPVPAASPAPLAKGRRGRR